MEDKKLIEALRQYKHNDDSGLVAGYDVDLINSYVAELKLEKVKLENLIAGNYESIRAAYKQGMGGHMLFSKAQVILNDPKRIGAYD